MEAGADAGQVATMAAASISAGYDFTCALTGGTVECWGDNLDDALGNSTADAGSSTPVAVTGF